MGFEITAFMQLFEELSKTDSAAYPGDDITSIQKFDQLPNMVSRIFFFFLSFLIENAKLFLCYSFPVTQ